MHQARASQCCSVNPSGWQPPAFSYFAEKEFVVVSYFYPFCYLFSCALTNLSALFILSIAVCSKLDIEIYLDLIKFPKPPGKQWKVCVREEEGKHPHNIRLEALLQFLLQKDHLNLRQELLNPIPLTTCASFSGPRNKTQATRNKLKHIPQPQTYIFV